MNCWYSDVDIQLLLKHEAQDDIHICQAITEDVNQISMRLNEVLKIFQSNESINAALIPINIGHNFKGVFNGSHWVSLVLINDKCQNTHALFADPLGQSIRTCLPIVNQILQNFLIPVSFDSEIIQQTNDYDCGPWTVFNLYSLARAGQLPKHVNEISIEEQRQLLNKLRKTQLSIEEQQIIKIPDNYPSKEDLDILDSIPITKPVSDLSNSNTVENDNLFNSVPVTLNRSNISFPLEMHTKIVNTRESHIKSHEMFNVKTQLSLEDETLNLLDSISKDQITDENENENENHKSQKKDVEIKKQDIMKLIEILQIIDLCVKKELDLNKTFIKLGNLSGGTEKISYNNQDENCIRNKYGYIRRHKESSVNQNGIYFEKIYQMKLVLDSCLNNGEINSCLDYFNSKSEDLQNDLLNVKNQIMSILVEENEFVPMEYQSMINKLIEPTECHMEHIINFTNIYYHRMILDRIKVEVSKIEKIDFEKIEDRYYLARILTIVGEFGREYMEHNTLVTDEDIREMFKHLKTLRNLFIHCHEKIANGIADEEQIKNLNVIIAQIVQGLYECLEGGILKENYNYKDIITNIQHLKQLFSKSNSENSTQLLNNITKENEQSKSSSFINIKKLILKAFDILTKNPKKIVKLLAKLDEKYQINLNQISDKNNQDYPIALNMEQKENIIKYVQIQLSASETKGISELENNDGICDVIGEDSTAENTKIPLLKVKASCERNINNKYKTEVIKLIKQAHKKISDNPPNMLELLNKLNINYQVQIKLITFESSDNYPVSLDLNNAKIIEQYVKYLEESKKSRPGTVVKSSEETLEDSSLSDKLSIKFKELIRETNYLCICENVKTIEDTKRPYVIEHIVSIIGQIMRDITSLNSNIKALSTSNIHDFASRSATSARNQGLAHDIFAFDKNWLNDQIQNNILPAHKHFQSILTIFNKNDCEVSRITLFSIAFSFLNLGFYDHAVDYFKRTIDYIAKHPEEIKEAKYERIKNFQNLFQINIQANFEELMGVDIYSFICRLYLMQTYLIAGKYDDSYKESEILKRNIQIEKVMRLKDESISCLVYDVINGLVHCLLIKGNNKGSINLLNEIIPISNYPFFKVSLAWAYHFENKPKEAYQLIQSLLPFNFEPIKKYIALFRYVRILSYQQNKKESIKKATKSISEMEELFKSNYRLFKEQFDDEFLIMQTQTIRLKVQLLVDKSSLPDNNEEMYERLLEQLEEYISQYNSIIRHVKHDLQDDVRIPSMQFWFCRAYSSIINDKVSDIEKEKRKLDNAQVYFDKARLKLDYFKQTGRISVSNIKEMIKTADYLAYAYNKFAARPDQKEELREIFMNKAAPYMAMVKRYMARYQSLQVNTQSNAQAPSTFIDNIKINCDEEIIEKAIVAQFIASKIKTSAKDANININTKTLNKEKLKNFCFSILKIEPSDLEFENHTCWISLGKNSIEILRQKVACKENEK